jgi:hypothetical protein
MQMAKELSGTIRHSHACGEDMEAWGASISKRNSTSGFREGLLQKVGEPTWASRESRRGGCQIGVKCCRWPPFKGDRPDRTEESWVR